ncbi:hypothetical protein AMS68_006948 [Peltaster fructicola]|uniref:Uncharacterized protein n=1 Tax=Peltaster fructicola TaxID=286661 RepID=A0A6H0Y3E3_9PEZI|nr:hypothetical protein AMS68_006948 [Peltaster fructicola]
MSSGAQSFLDKLKDVFSKIFKSKKRQESSFKTPQELQRSRYGTADATPEKRSPAVAGARTAEISQSPPAPAPAPAPAKTSMQASRAPPAIQRLREAMNNDAADVSPTEPPTFRTDRPHSAAVSALEQEGVAERVNKAGETEPVKDSAGKEEDKRPISDIAAPNSQKTAQSPTIAERTAGPAHAQSPISTTETAVEPEAEESEVPPYTEDTAKTEYPAEKTQNRYPDEKAQSRYPEEKAHSRYTEEAVQSTYPKEKAPVERYAEERSEPESDLVPADRVDPTTAPEVVNRFDDEKVPVITEPPATTPAESKFRMSATSGPLEDYPDYYGS